MHTHQRSADDKSTKAIVSESLTPAQTPCITKAPSQEDIYKMDSRSLNHSLMRTLLANEMIVVLPKN